MFINKLLNKESQLDAELKSALTALASLEKTDEKYGKLVENVARLHKLKTEDRPKRISPDTALVVAANIFGILWIARYEREHVITGKGIGFVMKPR